MVAFRNRDHPGDDVRRQHVNFIRAFWELLAFHGYKRFLEEGAGLVVVNESDFLNKSLFQMKGIEIGYITKTTPIFKDLLAEQELGWFKTYDAETTLLVGFVRSDNGFSSYRIQGLPGGTPKELFEKPTM